MQLRPNTLLQGGKYRIVKELGSGGFGITYKAVQVALNRYVAIKEFFMKDFCVRGSSSTQMSVGSEGCRGQVERYRKKFVKEARTIAQFKHPHIIGIHDIFEENGTAYYVMDFLEEGSLNDYLKKQGRLSETEALYYIRQIADALDYIHQQNINHLDVKPGNIMLDDKHNAVLIDFGLAKSYDGDGNQESTTPVGVSAGYAPTEQYMRGGVGKFSPETDIYSLGATLYKLVTGKTPPEAQEVTDYGLPAFPSFVSRQVASAITQAMQPRRVDRPHSIGAFLQLLQEVKASSVDTTKTEYWLFNGTTRIKLVVILGLVMILGGIGIWLKGSDSEVSLVSDTSESSEISEDSESLYRNGMEFYQKKQYENAFDQFQKSALKSNADAEYMLGYMYSTGEGVPLDYNHAFTYYSSAADKGNAKALFQLGHMYQDGKGRQVDLEQAASFYRRALDSGYAEAKQALLLVENDIEACRRLEQRKSEPEHKSEHSDDVVYDKIDEMPSFPGGVNGLVNYLSSNLHYPAGAQESGTQGTVILQFIVDVDGSVENVKVVKSVHPDLDKEAIRVVKSMPLFNPGRIKGKAVRVSYTLPIKFKLE